MRIDAIPIGKNPPHRRQRHRRGAGRRRADQPVARWTRPPARCSSTASTLGTPMRYPGNYGFVPHTLSLDGDPIDVLVAKTRQIIPGAVINVRPVGVLKMNDESGGDEKIIAVPSPKLTQRYVNIHTIADLPQITSRADPALLRALQGSGTRQMGEAAGLGRCRRGPCPDHRRGIERSERKATCWRRQRLTCRADERGLAGPTGSVLRQHLVRCSPRPSMPKVITCPPFR